MLERSRAMFGAFSTSTTTCLLAACLTAFAGQAQALGLGDITLHSSLGQPLNADIALVDAQGLAAADLSVSLATTEEFARAGVDRAFFLNDLRFTPVLTGPNKFIHVTSSKAVTEPYLDFLVQLNRPSGQLLREFTVLIDPPGAVSLPPAPKFDDAPVSSIASAASTAATPVPAPRAAAPRAPEALPPATQNKRLEVQKGDTLWSISKRLQAAGTTTPPNTLSRELRALNPGKLKAGQSLLLPDSAVLPSAAPAPSPAQVASAAPPAVAPITDAPTAALPTTDDLALHKDVDELNGKLLALQAQMDSKDQQLLQLQQQLAQARTASKPAAPAAPVAPAVPVAPVVDDSSDIPWLPILGVVLILLLLGGLVYNRRRQAEALVAAEPPLAFDDDVLIKPAQTGLAPALELAGEESGSASPRRDSGPATDAMDGASIYIAYGRFNEACAILREGLQKEPQRTDLRLRLLEVLGQQGDVAGFAEEERALLAQDFSAEKIDAIRGHYPKLQPVPAPAPAPVAAPAAAVVVPAAVAAVAAVAPAIVDKPAAVDEPMDDFQLNLDDLSMDADWDLVSPFDPAPARKGSETPAEAAEPVDVEFASNLKEFPDVFEMPDEQFLSDFAEEEPPVADDGLDDAFLDNFVAGADLPELDSLTVDFDNQDSAEESAQKLEQAQSCIDEGDLSSASDLLHELLREGDEAYKQAARHMLSKIA